jgi:hypothetical protein
MNYGMYRVLGLFVTIGGEDARYGFVATLYLEMGTFEAMHEAAREQLQARMARHDVRLVEEGACRTLCVIVGMYTIPPESDLAKKPDGFTFFRQDTLWSRVSGAADSAWRRWRRPDLVLI